MYTSFKRISQSNFSRFRKLNDFPVDSLMTEGLALNLERLFNIYLARFSYNKLPEETQLMLGNRNYIDAMLFFQPSVCWFKTKKYGLQCLPTTGEYKFNLVGRPIKWTARAFTGETFELNDENSVIMFNDQSMSIPFLQLQYNAEFMDIAELTLKQNLEAQKQPYIIEAEEEALKSAQAEFDQLSHFKPFIFKRKTGRKEEPIETKVFQTGVPIIAKDLDDIYNTYLNRCLTYLGINNITVQDKKERLITSEASANDMLIQSYYTSAYDQRKIAVDKVNKMFGTNIKFDATDLQSMVTAIQNEYSQGIVMAENKNNQGGNSNDNR